jgi:serine/threonine protein kinase
MPDADRQIELLLFDAALQIADESTLLAFLNQTCAAHPEMRERLDELLEAHLVSDAYFSTVIKACTATAESTPLDTSEDVLGVFNHLGAYQLLERIGEGGCGVVYLAEQESPVRRRVALKVIRPGMDSERVIARFEMERQALAMMDHPHIAHVLDVGTTPYGRPYFAMEWVRGRKITDFCDEQHLDIRQRLELFIEVCHAIQHAHQKGVIHRDIKPSNVLVSMQDGKPQPKIIDFGIAKATDGSQLTPCLTEVGGLPMGTLASMSPEQAVSGGSNVDTRGDVYSLGILLYELVCGRPAFDSSELNAVGYPAALEILEHREVPPPSSIIAGLSSGDAAESASCRNANPAKWLSSVKGDLDQVIMKCLEKDRSRRYETVNGLALDLTRFLASEPVMARPPSALYRFRKFVARNRAACISSLAILFTVLAGFAVSTGMYLRENAALKEQQRLRQQAQARANVSHASLLLTQGKTEDADAILRQTPLNTIEPSQEATGVFRTLGDWHLVQHRWKAAAECYQLLPMANRFIPEEIISDTGDTIRTAPALVLAGMDAAYEQHRLALLDRYSTATTHNPVEQAVKMSLLKPAPPEVLERLRPMAAFLKNHADTVSLREYAETDPDRFKRSAPRDIESPRMHILTNTALALYELRCSNPAAAIQRAERALELSKQYPADANDDFQAFLHPILLMACRQTGDTTRAAAELERVKQYVQTHGEAFDHPIPLTDTDFLPVIERALAMILAREALGAE